MWTGKFFAAGVGLLVTPLVVTALPPPLHPTSLRVDYQGQFHDVIAVEKESPVIALGDGRKRLTGKAQFTTERVSRYAGPTANLTGMKMTGVQVVNAMSDFEAESSAPAATIGGFIEFDGTVTADQDLADCYLVFVAYDRAFLTDHSANPNAQIRVRHIPNLVKGVPTKIKFSTSPFLTRTPMNLFGLLFSAGQEVRTNPGTAVGAYFQRREQVVHASKLAAWLRENPHLTQAAKPVMQVPPLFASAADLPTETSATLTVGPDGLVSSVNLSGELPEATRAILLSTLGAWLFLPRITAGLPVASHVIVPLRF